MSTPITQEKQVQKIIHTLPYLRNRWIVKIDGELDYLKVFFNKCEAIDYGREIARLNTTDHWIHHSNGTVMQKETYLFCDEMFKKYNNQSLN